MIAPTQPSLHVFTHFSQRGSACICGLTVSYSGTDHHGQSSTSEYALVCGYSEFGVACIFSSSVYFRSGAV